MKIFSRLILCMIILTCFSSSLFAATLSEKGVNIALTDCDKVFVKDLDLTSIESQKNIQILGDDLRQIVLCAQKGGETWTIGLLKPKSTLDYDEILSMLNETIGKIDTNLCLAPNDFEVRFYEISSDRKDKSMLLSRLAESPGVLKHKENGFQEYSCGFAEQSQLPINGSYYFMNTTSNRKSWHNQVTGQNSYVLASDVSPYEGDGNNRYESGYRWFPSYVKAEFFRGSFQIPQTWAALYFRFTENELNNLNVDNNEALEMEIVFYNYTNASTNERGYSFLPVDGNPSEYTLGYDYRSPRDWFTNFDKAYLDTAFCDSIEEVSACVGVYDTSSLVANKTYYWEIDYYGHAIPQGYEKDGSYKISAQRSYVKENQFVTMPFKVFSEEHEGFVRYGVDLEHNWVSSAKNAFFLARQDRRYFECDLNNGGLFRYYPPEH